MLNGSGGGGRVFRFGVIVKVFASSNEYSVEVKLATLELRYRLSAEPRTLTASVDKSRSSAVGKCTAIMANPRKFSEKIALHTHRQAEETARFEQIMKEVSDATARVSWLCSRPSVVEKIESSERRKQHTVLQ